MKPSNSKLVVLMIALAAPSIVRAQQAPPQGAEPEARREARLELTSADGDSVTVSALDRATGLIERCATPCVLPLHAGRYVFDATGPYAARREDELGYGVQRLHVRPRDGAGIGGGVTLIVLGGLLSMGGGLLAIAGFTSPAFAATGLYFGAPTVFVGASITVPGAVLVSRSVGGRIERAPPLRPQALASTATFTSDAQGAPYVLTGVAF